MNTNSLGGGASSTILTIEGYLGVLAKLEPCKFVATVEFENGPIYISAWGNPNLKKSPLAIVYEILTDTELTDTAAFCLPSVEALGIRPCDILQIRYAELGLKSVGETHQLETGTPTLRERLISALAPLLVVASFPCVACQHEGCDFRASSLTPAA